MNFIIRIPRAISPLQLRAFSTCCLHRQEPIPNEQQPSHDQQIESINTKIRLLDYQCRSLLAEMQNVARTAKQESEQIKKESQEIFLAEIETVAHQMSACLNQVSDDDLNAMLQKINQSEIDLSTKALVTQLTTALEGIRMTEKILLKMIQKEEPIFEESTQQQQSSRKYVIGASIVILCGIAAFSQTQEFQALLASLK
jgi:molecular chaperone GrpE (heat shock protein)